MNINKAKNLSLLIKGDLGTLLISTLLLLIALLIIPGSASAQFGDDDDKLLTTPTPGSTQSNTVTLRPNANGAVNQWIPFLCLLNWQCVVGTTVDTSYVLTGAANQTDLYNLSDVGASPDIQGAAITGITVRATAVGAGVFHLMVRTNGQNRQGPSIFLQRIYTTYNWTLPQNPVTNAPWTLDEVNSLQIGVATSVISAPLVNSAWAEVVFARLTPTPSLSPTPIPPTASCQLKPQGDANCDGRVNTDDFNIWRDEFLGVLSSKSSDFNNDGVINTDDFNIWRDGFLNQNIPH